MSSASDFFSTSASGGSIFPVIPPNGYWSNKARVHVNGGADKAPPGFLKDGDTIHLPNSELVGTGGTLRPITYYSHTGAVVWTGAPSNVFGTDYRWVAFMMDTVEDRLYYVLANDTTGAVRMGYATSAGLVQGSGGLSAGSVVTTSNPSYYWGGENASTNNPVSMHRDANGSGGFKVYVNDIIVEFDSSMEYVTNLGIPNGGDNQLSGVVPVQGFTDLFWRPFNVQPAGSAHWEPTGIQLTTVSNPPTGNGQQTATTLRGVVDQANGLPRNEYPGAMGVLQWGDQYLIVPSSHIKVSGFTRFDKVVVDGIMEDFCNSIGINDIGK